MTCVDLDVDIELVGVREFHRLQDGSVELSPSPTISIKTDNHVYPVTSIDPLEEDAPVNAVSLPPTDRGFHAWAYLASAWTIELLVWSVPFSYGVFLNYYTTHTFKDNPSSLLALVGSLSTGIIYLSAVIITPIVSRYPRQKKHLMAVGVTLSVAGLVGAAFSTKPWQLVITQGMLYAIGGSCLYFPVITYMFEWFSEKRGFANGLIFSGTGIGGVIVPLLLESLLNKYGPKTTLLSLAIAFLIFSIPTFPYIKSRLPPAQVVAPKSLDIRFIRYWPFWILFLATTVQGLGTYMPNLYLPTFAKDIKLSTTDGTISLSLLNGASVPGLIFLGWLSDRYDIRFSILLSALGSSAAVFLLWGLSESLAPLLVFSCVHGFLAFSWCALYPRFSSSVAGDDPHLSATMMSVFIAGRGIGNALSAPIAGGLRHPWILTDRSPFAYGIKGYGPLITFTGITLGISSFGIAYRSFGELDPNVRVLHRERRESLQASK